MRSIFPVLKLAKNPKHLVFYSIVKRTPWYTAIPCPHYSFFFSLYFGSFVRSKRFKFGALDSEKVLDIWWNSER